MTSEPQTARFRHLALMGGLRRAGAWQVPETIQVISGVGGADIDLTQATLGPVTEITKISLVGGVKLRVPTGVRVDVQALSLTGGSPRGPLERDAGPDSPVVRVRSYSIFGGVSVTVG